VLTSTKKYDSIQTVEEHKIKQQTEVKGMRKHIAIVHEKGEYDYATKYVFDSDKERREFLIRMAGVLICTEAYSE
jgi:hypothetical protein